MASVRLSRILISVLCFLILIPLFVHYYLSKVCFNNPEHYSDASEKPFELKNSSFFQVERDVQFSYRGRSTSDAFEDFTALRAFELRDRIKEMMRIKGIFISLRI